MKYGKMLMLAVVVILMFAGSAMAAELTVNTQGTGEGTVFGDGIECGYDCIEIYPDETILHLKAVPDVNSKFMGWLVDGEPQEGTLIIRKDITVTAIFDKKSIPEFEIVGTRPSEFAYFTDFGPLYDTKREIVGAIQGVETEDGFKARVIIPEKATLTIPEITSIVVPAQGNHLVAYGEIFLDLLQIEGEKPDLSLYALDGTLIKFVKSDINGPFWQAEVGHKGDFWVAGTRGTTSYDPLVIRRYSPEGELMWEQPLSDTPPDQLVLSPDNSYVALTLRKFHPDAIILHMYDGDGKIVYERELPPFFYGVEFVSDQTVLFHDSRRWELYRLDNLETPFASGKFAGNPIVVHPIIGFPPGNCFLVKTVMVKEKVATGYHLQAVHRETGQVLAEHLFEVSSEEDLLFYRITERSSFELLINGNTIMELRIPE